MKVIVQKHKILLEKEPINEKEINVSYCEFEFDEDITNDFVKEAYFTLDDKTYKQIINNNRCDYPSEILDKSGVVMIGVVAYKVIDELTEIRYNPSPAYFYTLIGSLKEAENTQPITPSEMEQYEQQLQDGLAEIENLNITATRVSDGVEINIADKQGQISTTKVNDGLSGSDGTDGIGLDYNWNGTSLGIKKENESSYEYVNLKGDTGASGRDGVDGVSPTITSSKSGTTTTITITDKSGTTTATINDGTNGTNGQDGYTPQRGVDYWTTSDIQAIQSYCDSLVLGALGGSY